MEPKGVWGCFTQGGWWKPFLAWVGTIVGAVTLSKLVLFSTLVFTWLQIWVFWRTRVRKMRKTR